MHRPRTTLALVDHHEHRAPRRERDIRALGARALDAPALVRLVCGRVDDTAVDDAVHALGLEPSAREAALLQSPLGPRLLAAVELGRRAWLAPAPTATRITGPAEAVAALGPRLVDDEHLWLLALDVRLRVVAARSLGPRGAAFDVVGTLQQTLMHGARRLVLVHRQTGPAIVDSAVVGRLLALVERAALVDVLVLDHVIAGDDGWVSLLRQGILPTRSDLRYR